MQDLGINFWCPSARYTTFEFSDQISADCFSTLKASLRICNFTVVIVKLFF